MNLNAFIWKEFEYFEGTQYKGIYQYIYFLAGLFFTVIVF